MHFIVCYVNLCAPAIVNVITWCDNTIPCLSPQSQVSVNYFNPDGVMHYTLTVTGYIIVLYDTW